MGKSGKSGLLPQETAPKPKAEPTLRDIAHRRLDQLWTEAEGTDFYGRVGVVAIFEAGKARTLERELKGTDK